MPGIKCSHLESGRFRKVASGGGVGGRLGFHTLLEHSVDLFTRDEFYLVRGDKRAVIFKGPIYALSFCWLVNGSVSWTGSLRSNSGVSLVVWIVPPPGWEARRIPGCHMLGKEGSLKRGNECPVGMCLGIAFQFLKY